MTFENVSQLSDALADAYDTLIVETNRVALLVEDMALAQLLLQEKADFLLLQYRDNPKDLGPIDSIREANLRSLTERQSAYVLEVSQKLRAAKNKQEIARITVDHLRAQVRVWEMAVSVRQAGEKGVTP